ncbi:protein tyrosine phosphatase receptor type C-associated protein [Melopsittacus undulatus]|uniref:protein tyrosine phosphatase receptor type C-associated protein n=1 Tax=Melopsittacus undulatus TaxID=13146 RepID=UPI00146DAF6C|nr:protein tyrosine phosphatase receptor type C-associated protein [Melopsittacus undulatus]
MPHPSVPAPFPDPAPCPQEPEGSGRDRAVGALLGLLLCLAVGLALAWHHLCRLSGGRYHPSPMGRRAMQRLRERWRRLRREEEEEEEGDKEEVRRERRTEPEPEEEVEEEEAEAAVGAGESPPSVGQAAGGSAEALLSEIHAFSGTAAWGEPQPSGTAL